MEKSHAKAQSRKGKLRRSEIFIANDAKKEASSVGATWINWPLRQLGGTLLYAAPNGANRL